MERGLLDTAFGLLIALDLPIDTVLEHVEPAKARIHALSRQFPATEAHEVEAAYRRAEELLAVACELADVNRGPRNDGTGPAVNEDDLARRCPGFSTSTYSAARNAGFLWTR